MEEKEIWLNLLFFFIVFLLVYVITYFINLQKFKKKKIKTIGEYNYLVTKFRLNFRKLNVRKMLLWFSLLDAFIIAFVTTFITLVDMDTIWQMVIGFVLLFVLIYACYEIYGRHLVSELERKEEKNEL